MGFVRAARKDEIPQGSIREFQVDGLTVAIANIGNKFYALNNTCLHRGVPPWVRVSFTESPLPVPGTAGSTM